MSTQRKLSRLAARRARLTAQLDGIDGAIGAEVTALRAAGFSWAAIAADLGCTRQAAQQRYGAP